MKRLTLLQERMIRDIALDLLTPVNGTIPKTASEATTYAEMVIETKEDQGVFTSLLTAGYVHHIRDIGNEKDNIAGLTEKGFEYFVKYLSQV